MSSQQARVWLFAICSSAALACSFDDTRKDKCESASDCSSGRCEQGFCIRTSGIDRKDGGDSERDATTGMMNNPSTGTDAGRPRNDAGMMSRPDGGAQDSGMSMMPSDAGSGTCRDGEIRACMLPGSSAERCRTGNQTCENGRFGTCVASETPSAEQCNGVDDDCDGETDEDADEDCYPDNTPGCTLSANQPPDCAGVCLTGKRLCRNGALEPCAGAIPPQMEACTALNGASADENCDGRIDETCSCAAGEMRSCYTAASGTINVGICRAGNQVCTNGSLGPCMGSVVPQAETCMNETTDDNCNGMVDDIPNRGMMCLVASNMGACRTGIFQCQGNRAELTCVTPMPGDETCNTIDDDCDGQTDETVNLQTDNANCGMCGRVCAMDQTCCGGACVNLQTDAMHCGACGAPACAEGSSCCGGMCIDTRTDAANCGMCGRACATGESCCGGSCVNTQENAMNCGMCGRTCSEGAQPGCCGGECVDLVSQDHCGSCDNRCGVLEGVTCVCGMMGGETRCIAPVLGVCL